MVKYENECCDCATSSYPCKGDSCARIEMFLIFIAMIVARKKNFMIATDFNYVKTAYLMFSLLWKEVIFNG